MRICPPSLCPATLVVTVSPLLPNQLFWNQGDLHCMLVSTLNWLQEWIFDIKYLHDLLCSSLSIYTRICISQLQIS